MTKHIHGGDVYKYDHCLDFSANCNPLGTPQSVKKAIIDSVDGLSDYPRVGCGPLKEAIAVYEQTQKEYLICGNGAADLIFSLCRAKNPKKALLLAPTFAEYEQALVSVGCEITRYYLEETSDFCVEENYLQLLKTEKPDIIFLCNPNNPTGITMPQELPEKILASCSELGIFMVVDECFLDFVKDPDRHTLKGKLAEHPNLFLLKAFTKRYAIPGVRLGYGFCSDRKVLERMEAVTALECIYHGTAGRTGGAERNGIRRKRKKDHFSGICVAEGRNDKAWPEGISVRGKLYILSWTGRFI